jgi:maleate isomerase
MMSPDSRGRARIGALVPFTNTNLEPDLTLMRPEGVSLHFARLGGYDEDEIPDETQMAGLGESDLSEPLRLLAGVKPDIVLYGCTSATLTHGAAFDEKLAEDVRARCGAPAVTAAGSLVEAMKDLGVSRIAFTSPYVAAINDAAVAFLASRGIETVHRYDMSEVLDNAGQGALTPADVLDLARRADGPKAEAVVLSCTDMRSVEAVAAIEAELGKPVLSSNLALMAAATKRLGLDAPSTPRCRLFA